MKPVLLAAALCASISLLGDVVIHTKDGKAIRVAVDPASIASIEFLPSGISPEPPSPPSLQDQLKGDWSWTCCAGRHSGTFKIDRVAVDGAFSGRFGKGQDDGDSPISGRITGDRLQFTRTILANGVRSGEQVWKARLVNAGGRWTMAEGDWQGLSRSSNNGGFSATRK